MLGHVDEVIPIADGRVCHLRVVQVGACKYKLFMCKAAKEYLQDLNMPELLEKELSPSMLLDALKTKLMIYLNRQNRRQRSYEQLLSEIQLIGFDKLISFNGEVLSVRAPDGCVFDINLDTIPESLADAYKEGLSNFTKTRKLEEIRKWLRENYHVSSVASRDSLLVYTHKGCRIRIIIRDDHIIDSDTGHIYNSTNEFAAHMASLNAATKHSSCHEEECRICGIIEDENLPNIGCSKCKSCFHDSCLLDWMYHSGTSTFAFGVTSGPCPGPDCDNILSIKM